MRSLCLLILTAASAFAGPFGFGLKAGIPMTDFTNAVSSGRFDYTSKTQRYIVGPMVELRLPFGFGIEADALYRRFSYNSVVTGTGDHLLHQRQRLGVSDPREVPFSDPHRAAVHRRRNRLGHPARSEAGCAHRSREPRYYVHQHSGRAASKTTTGFVLGFGVDVHALIIHISPEIRYTRWGAQHFLDQNGGFHSSQNQAEFLVGITF